jgi:hypothetical protein
MKLWRTADELAHASDRGAPSQKRRVEETLISHDATVGSAHSQKLEYILSS